MSKDQKELNFSSDSESENDLPENRFVRNARLEFTDSPMEATHGIAITCSMHKTLAGGKVSRDAKFSNRTESDYEIDAFRLKIVDDVPSIQIVENKSLLGLYNKPTEQLEWIGKVRKKIEALVEMQKNIRALGPQSVLVKIRNEKYRPVHEVTGVEKLKFIEAFLECRAVKFRFAAEKTELGSFPALLDAEIVKLTQEFSTAEKPFVITRSFDREDAASDKIHFEQRFLKYQHVCKNLKSADASPKKLDHLTGIDEKSENKPEVDNIQPLLKKMKKLSQWIQGLNNDVYPKECKTVTLKFDKNNSSGGFIGKSLRKYNKKREPQEHPTHLNLLKEAIQKRMTEQGFTAEFKYKVIFPEDNAKSVYIEVYTKPSKYELILKCEKRQQELSAEIEKILAQTAEAVETKPTPPRGQLSGPFDLPGSASRVGILGGSPKVSLSKPQQAAAVLVHS